MEKEDMQKEKPKVESNNQIMGTTTNQRRVLTSGKVARNNHNKQWIRRWRNKYKKKKYGLVKGKYEYYDDNTFKELRDKEERDEEKDEHKGTTVKEHTKDCVNQSFWNEILK